jgi:hypothetical protein
VLTPAALLSRQHVGPGEAFFEAFKPLGVARLPEGMGPGEVG